MRSLQFHHRFHDFDITRGRCCIVYIIFGRQFRRMLRPIADLVITARYMGETIM